MTTATPGPVAGPFTRAVSGPSLIELAVRPCVESMVILTVYVGVALAGQGGFDAPAAAKTAGIVVDLITPETETSIWYFWGLARNFRPEDKALTASIREAQGKVFMEDLEMLESQQRNLLARPERKLLSLNTDLGGVQARRIIDRLVEQERSPS